MKSKIQALSVSVASVLIGISIATDQMHFYSRSFAEEIAAAKLPSSTGAGTTFADTATISMSNSSTTMRPNSSSITLRSPTATSSQKTALATKPQLEFDPQVEEMIRKMPLKAKVGQMMIVGFMGDTVDYSLKEILEKVQPGAVIVFGRNIKTARQVAKLNFSAQKVSLANSKVPLLIAVDQEGGNVIRIHTPFPLPSALALGETQDPALVQKAGRQTGILLHALGFNMNLAPVLDVSDPEKDLFIGTRTYGKSPKTVATMGSNFADGLTSAGILPTAKHFPGHGGANDSHLDTPEKFTSLDQLLGYDLLPFNQIAKSRSPWAIMVAHVSYPKIDHSLLPATFSKVIMTDLLRTRMGFQGIVMTDDIEMAGAAIIKDLRKRAITSVLAGADLVMLAWNKREQINVANALISAVKNGVITESRIDESVRRILRAKKSVGALQPPVVPSEKDLLLALQNSDLRQVSDITLRNKFQRAVAEIANSRQRIVANTPNRAQNVFIGTTEDVLVFTGSDRFYKSFRSSLHPARKSIQLRLTTATSTKNGLEMNQALLRSPKALGLFFVSGSQSAKMLRLIQPQLAKRVLVINSETPGMIPNPNIYLGVVATYFRHPEIGSYTAKYIFNREPFATSNADQPISLPPRSPAAVAHRE